MPQQRAQEVLYRAGDFAYRMHVDWAKWPDGLKARLEDEQLNGLACDADGNLYALTRMKDVGIVVFAPDGTAVRTFGAGLMEHAHMMRFSPRGTLWLADDRGHVCKEIDLLGNVLRTLGTGVPSDSGYDASVPWPDDLKTIARAAPPFYRPTAVSEAPDGTLFVSDGYANVAVHRFAADGTLEKTWGGPGTAPGTFRLPHSVWLDARDRVWIADRENDRVQVFTRDGEVLACFEDMLYPSDFDSDGTWMYVAEALGGMTVLDMDLRIVAQLGYRLSPLQAHSICINARGDVFMGIMSQPHKLVRLEHLES